MVWPGIVPYSFIDSLIRVSGPFGPKLPDAPVISMFGVKKGNEAVERVSVGSLRVGLARAGAVGKQESR